MHKDKQVEVLEEIIHSKSFDNDVSSGASFHQEGEVREIVNDVYNKIKNSNLDENYIDYILSHKERYIKTICTIPKPSKEANVLDIGGHVFFAYLLKKCFTMFNVEAILLSEREESTYVNEIIIEDEVFSEKVMNLDLNDSENISLKKNYDYILCLEVIEHIKHDPMAVFSMINKNLVEEGLFIISTPNSSSFFSMDRLFQGLPPQVYWTYDKDDDLDKHVFEYSRIILELIVSLAGFEVIKTITEYFYSSYLLERDLFYLIFDAFDLPINQSGDTIIITSRKKTPVLERYPDALYNIDKFSGYYSKIWFKKVNNKNNILNTNKNLNDLKETTSILKVNLDYIIKILNENKDFSQMETGYSQKQIEILRSDNYSHFESSNALLTQIIEFQEKYNYEKKRSLERIKNLEFIINRNTKDFLQRNKALSKKFEIINERIDSTERNQERNLNDISSEIKALIIKEYYNIASKNSVFFQETYSINQKVETEKKELSIRINQLVENVDRNYENLNTIKATNESLRKEIIDLKMLVLKNQDEVFNRIEELDSSIKKIGK